MPELLLSSSPVKNLAPSSHLNSSKDTQVSSMSGMVEGSVAEGKKEGGFNNILSSMVNKPVLDSEAKVSENDLKELGLALEDLMSELEKLDPDSEMLASIQTFIDGQDFSTLNLETVNDGLSLPNFLSDLESMVDSMLKNVEVEGNPVASGSNQEIEGLNAAFLHLNTLINKITSQSENTPKASNNSLLGFSFDSGKGKSGLWQQYDPQQMSQAANTLRDLSSSGNSPVSSPMSNTVSNSINNPINGSIEGSISDTANKTINNPISNQNPSVVSQHLVSETDQTFKAQIEELITGKSLDTSDIVDSLSNSMVDTKDKGLSKFSDIQLRTPNETLKQYSTTLSSPVNSDQWTDEVSQKIVWFTGRNIQLAEMHLNPAELGPIDVKIHVQNEVATVTFNVNNTSVRDLLESNVVRLREMMEANGVNVGEVNVDSGSREQPQQSGSDSAENGFAQPGQEADENGDMVMTEKEVIIKQTNLVDYFV